MDRYEKPEGFAKDDYLCPIYSAAYLLHREFKGESQFVWEFGLYLREGCAWFNERVEGCGVLYGR